jgi:hypothetical protein
LGQTWNKSLHYYQVASWHSFVSSYVFLFRPPITSFNRNHALVSMICLNLVHEGDFSIQGCCSPLFISSYWSGMARSTFIPLNVMAVKYVYQCLYAHGFLGATHLIPACSRLYLYITILCVGNFSPPRISFIFLHL